MAEKKYRPLLDGLHVRARSKVLARQDANLRNKLIELRRKSGMTQTDLAELMGVSPQQVSKWERYDTDIRLSTLRRYANAVGAIVEHIVTIDSGESLQKAEPPNLWSSILSIKNLELPVTTATTPPVTFHDPVIARAKRTDFALSA